MRVKINLVLTFLIAFGSMASECVIVRMEREVEGRERRDGFSSVHASKISVISATGKREKEPIRLLGVIILNHRPMKNCQGSRLITLQFFICLLGLQKLVKNI